VVLKAKHYSIIVTMLQVLLEKGADLTIQDTWYQTPLMYCILTQYDEIAELLLQHDPDIVDIGDKYGKSALHIAVDVGSVECVKVCPSCFAYNRSLSQVLGMIAKWFYSILYFSNTIITLSRLIQL